MKRLLVLASGIAGLSITAAACSSTATPYGGATAPTTQAPAAAPGYGAATPPSTQAPPGGPVTTVAVGSTNAGTVLVNGQGRTLYLFEADTSGTSTCVSTGCVAEWPPFLAGGTPQPAGGLVATALGTTARADGTRQVTYDGHPLYLFAGDTKAGSANGRGLDDNGGLWYPVRSNGTAVR